MARKSKTAVLDSPPKPVVDRNDPEFEAILKKLKLRTAASHKEEQDAMPVISTGCPALDWGIGKIDPVLLTPGLPLRSYIELFGSTGAGKSSTYEIMMAAMQQRFPKCIIGLLCSERPVLDRMKAYGVDLERVIMINCWKPVEGEEAAVQLAEDGLDQLCKLTRYKECMMAGIDSWKGLTSAKQVYEKGDVNKAKDRSFYDSETAVRAQLGEKFFNRQKTDNKNSTLVIVNQTSESIQEDYRVGSEVKPKTPGGRRKEFECELRIGVESRPLRDLQEHELYKYKGQYGLEIIYTIFKNRYSPLRGQRKVITELDFDLYGFNVAKDILNAGTYLGLIERSGNWFTFFGKDGKTHRENGKADASAWLMKHPRYMSMLNKKIAARHPELHKLKNDERKKVKYELDAMVVADDDDIWGDVA